MPVPDEVLPCARKYGYEVDDPEVRPAFDESWDELEANCRKYAEVLGIEVHLDLGRMCVVDSNSGEVLSDCEDHMNLWCEAGMTLEHRTYVKELRSHTKMLKF